MLETKVISDLIDKIEEIGVEELCCLHNENGAMTSADLVHWAEMTADNYSYEIVETDEIGMTFVDLWAVKTLAAQIVGTIQRRRKAILRNP